MRLQLICVECACIATGDARGWQGHLVDLDDDGQDEIAFYCSICALQEFGRAA